MRFFYPTTACLDYSVYPVPKSVPESYQGYVKVGCRRCQVCDDERREQKRLKWQNRLIAYSQDWMEQGNRVVFFTLTVHDDDYPTEDELKERLKRLFKAHGMRCKRLYGERIKYWCVMERGDKTNRLHAHILFFVPKEVRVWSVEKWWIVNYWKERYKAFVFDSQGLHSSSIVSYVTKYCSKDQGWNNSRLCVSQFGWDKFMEVHKKKWLGIEEDAEGVTQWVAVHVERMDAEEAKVIARGQGIEGVIDKILDYKVVGRVETDKACLHPYAACFLHHSFIVKEKFLCVEKDDETEVLSILGSIVWVPAICVQERLSLLELEKHSLAQKLFNSM